MKLLKSVNIDHVDHEVLISDEVLSLKEAKNKGISTIAIDPKGILDRQSMP